MKLKDFTPFTVSKTQWINKQKAIAASKKNVPDSFDVSDELILVTHSILLDQFNRGVLKNPASIKVTSLVRDYIPTGGATKSAHLVGKAIDMTFHKDDLTRIQNDIRSNPSKYKEIAGIGFYTDGHIHYDVEHRSTNGRFKPYFAFWSNLPEDQKKNEVESLNLEGSDKLQTNNPFIWIAAIILIIFTYLNFIKKQD